MCPKRSQGITPPEPEEETLLLRDENPPRKETPLPLTQILVLLLLQTTEPLVFFSIRPYINQLVSELPIVGGDERKVGYYAGIILSSYFAAQAFTVLQWGRLSDKIGRKPVLLCGLLGTIASCVLFGMSRSFWALVLSRCMNGMLNGNTGIMKSMMAELTDETNMARGYSLIPAAWAVGSTLGPLIGGLLSRPQDRWPSLFSHPFWGRYPYLLPCLGTVIYALLLFTLAAIFLKETVNSDPVMEADSNSDLPRVRDGDEPAHDMEERLPLRALLIRPIVVSVANCGVVALLDITAGTLISLVWSTPVEFGGLSMSPASVGLWTAGYGFATCIIQSVAFPSFVRHFGPKSVVIASILCYFPIFSMFPFENLALRLYIRGLNPAAGLLMVLQLTAASFAVMGSGAISMYVSTAAPNKRSLGATNGVAQTMISIQRTVGPAAAASLLAFSLEHNVLDGNFVYVMLLVIASFGLGVAVLLPKSMWKHNEP